MNNEHREMLQNEIDIGFALDLDLSITNLQGKLSKSGVRIWAETVC